MSSSPCVVTFHISRRLPWKLLLQALKLFVVTAQLWKFVEYRYDHVNYNHHQLSSSSSYATFIIFLNIFVILLSLASLLLCLRAVVRAQLLKHESQSFLSRHYNWTFTVSERMEFLSLWYVMICANDCLIIMGSVIKQLIESRSLVGDMWDMCR